MSDTTVGNSKSISRASIFGPAPILPQEDPEAYDALLERVVGDIKPSGMIEEILVRDPVDHTWEILRWRRLRTDVLAEATAAVLRAKLSRIPKRGQSSPSDMLDDLFPPSTSVQKLVRKWIKKDPAAIRRINKLLTSINTTMASVTTEATIAKLDVIERIDQLVTTAEARRTLALREIDRHRLALAQALRDKINEIEDAEFKTVGPIAPQIEHDKNAA